MNCFAIIMILLYYLVFMLYCQKLFPAKKGGQVFVLLSLLCVLWLYLFLNTRNLSGFRFPAVMAVMIVGIYFSTGMNWPQAICGGSFCVLGANCFRGAAISVCSLALQGYSFASEETVHHVVTIFALPLALLFFKALRRTVFPDEKIKKFLNNGSQMRLIVTYEMMAAVNLMNLNFGRSLSPQDIWYPGSYLSTHGVWGAKVSIGNFLLTLGMLLYAVYQSIQSTELLEYRCTAKIMEEQYEQQLRHYQSYQKYTESFRAFRHDYKAMMVSLKALLRERQNDRALQLIDDLYDDMKNRVAIHKKYSENVILDAMLQDTVNLCEEKEIRFSFDVFVPRNTGLSKLDAIRIFSNITQNAIEACGKVPAPERFIDIVTRNDDQWATLEAINSYDGEILAKKGVLITTKLEKKEHGLGLQIVQEIAQSLGGFVIFDANPQRKTFLIRVHIPRVNEAEGEKTKARIIYRCFADCNHLALVDNLLHQSGQGL